MNSFIPDSRWGEARRFDAKSGHCLNYRLYLPESIAPDKKYRFLLFMPGNGSRGNDCLCHIARPDGGAVLRQIEASNKYGNNTIILAPQCPAGKNWVARDHHLGIVEECENPTIYLSAVIELFGQCLDTLPIDKSQIYLWGNSMGGFACWELLSRIENTFAAAVIIAGCGDRKNAYKYVNTPIWLSHGTADQLVPYLANAEMFEAIKKAGGDKIIFYTYPGRGHDIFTEIGSSSEVLGWLFGNIKA